MRTRRCMHKRTQRSGPKKLFDCQRAPAERGSKDPRGASGLFRAGRPRGTHLSKTLAQLSRARKPGGADRDRTDDLRLAKPALSQLSYSPDPMNRSDERSSIRFNRRPGASPAPFRASAWSVVGLGRFELPTSRLSGGRSNQLSYRPGSPNS